MSLDFYIAKKKESIDFNGEFVSLEEELQEFLYKNRDKIKYDVECIYAIDPYSDTKLDCESIKKIMRGCEVIKTSECLSDYESEDVAVEVFADLEKLCKKAIESNQKVFAMGD